MLKRWISTAFPAFSPELSPNEYSISTVPPWISWSIHSFETAKLKCQIVLASGLSVSGEATIGLMRRQREKAF